jgi:hypothetical protein
MAKAQEELATEEEIIFLMKSTLDAREVEETPLSLTPPF